MPPHPDDAQASLLHLVAGTQEVVLDPSLGGRAVSWTIGGSEVLDGVGRDPVEFGMYPMAPWAGRVRGNVVSTADGLHPLPVTYGPWALHGTVLARPMEIESWVQEDGVSEAILRSDLHPEWPWEMSVRVAWRVEPTVVTTVIRVHAPAEPFAAVVGWHPWFRRRIGEVDGQWSCDATGMLRRGEDLLPESWQRQIPDGPFDDAFEVPSGSATISWPGLLAIDVQSDGTWFVVYDGRDECICLEPQSGPPDGLGDRPWAPARIARRGAPVSQVVTWTIRDLRGGRG